MNTTTIELADIVRDYGEAYLARYQATSWHQRRVLLDIARCRTAAMGGHVEVCAACGVVRNAYNSCRNRHCPKCLGSARERWAQAREAELLSTTDELVPFPSGPKSAFHRTESPLFIGLGGIVKRRG